MTEQALDNGPRDEADELAATVEAFLDGEEVDPGALEMALADAAARNHFIELLIIRGAVGEMAPMTCTITRKPSRGSRRRVRWLAAAAGIVISLTAGFAAGQRVLAMSQRPPAVEAVIHLERPATAPAPTRVISLRPGVNWTEGQGGR